MKFLINILSDILPFISFLHWYQKLN